MSAQLSLWGGETGGDLLLELEQRGTASIQHNIPTEAIDGLVEAHANFTDNHPEPELETINALITSLDDLDVLDFSSDTQTEWHKYRTNLSSFAKPNGHTNRSLQAAALKKFDRKKLNPRTGKLETIQEDPKEYFHYYPTYRDRLQLHHERYDWGPIPPEVMELSRRMHIVHYMVKQALVPVFARMEDSNPGLAQHITPKNLDVSPIRSLRYHLGQGDILASGHYDRSWFSAQVADSHRGLRVRDPQTHKMVLVDTPPSVMPIFPAEKWPLVSPSSNLRPVWHDVINDPTVVDGRPLFGQNIARYAIIFFLNSHKLGAATNKMANHTEESQVA